MGLVRKLPWWVKLSAKLLLARLPLPYGFWRSLGLFRHGEMNLPQRAITTFTTYLTRAQQAGLEREFESLELGPGDSILSGLAARALGASRAWLLDAGHFATTDLTACQQTCELLKSQGASPPDISGASSVEEVLKRANVEYLTGGTASLAQIPDASIDFIWSQVVLEHVPKAELSVFFKELRRVIKPGGIGVHSIDFRDHLEGGLNNLRFSTATWESHYFQHSGFYTNRVRPRDMVALIEAAGFVVEVTKQTRWPQVPIARKDLAPEFRSLPDEDLIVAEIEITMKPRALA